MDRIWAVVDRVLPDNMRQTPDGRRVGRLVVLFAASLVAFAPVFVGVLVALEAPMLAWYIAVAATVIALAPVSMRVFRSPTVAVNQLILGVVWCMAMQATQASGHLSPGMAWFTVIPAFAMLLLGSRWALFWTATATVVVTGFVIAALVGVELPSVLSPSNQLLYWLLSPAAALVVHFVLVGTFEAAKTQMARELDTARALAEAAQASAEQAHGHARMVLDAVEQGLFMIDREGAIVGERSAAIERWLGSPDGHAAFWNWVAGVDAEAAVWLELGWDDVVSDFMPLDVVLDQIPRCVHVGARTLELSFQPLEAEGDWERMLVVATDVTEALAAQRAEKAKLELLAVLDKISKDRAGFMEFLGEADRLVAKLTTEQLSSAETFRVAHTLKGNCGLFGMCTVGEHCHQLESRLAEEARCLTADEQADLARVWEEAGARLAPLAGSKDCVPVPKRDIEALMGSVESGASHAQLHALVAHWTREPTAARLERIGAQAVALAGRLGKGDIQVVLRDNGLFLAPEGWAPFWSSFAHVVRNAVDHGLETADERVAAGKSEVGTITIETAVEHGELVVRLSDDGAGIQWDRVRAKAASMGLPVESHEDCVQALFADGMSTAEQVSHVSGRGVGLAACLRAAEQRGGRVEVQSEPGTGTTFCFWFGAEPVATQPLQQAA